MSRIPGGIKGIRQVQTVRATGFKHGTVRMLDQVGKWLFPNPGALIGYQPAMAGSLGPANLAFAASTSNGGGTSFHLSPELAKQKGDLISLFSLGGVAARHRLANLAFAFDAMASQHQNELMPDGTKVTAHLINIAEVIGRWGGDPETAAAALVQKLPTTGLGLAAATDLILQQRNAAEAFLLLPLQKEELSGQEADYLAKICLLQESDPAVWMLIAATYLKTIPTASAAEKALLASRSHQILPILLRLFNLEKAAMELEDAALFHWNKGQYEHWESVLANANTQERRAEIQYLKKLTEEISELLQEELGASSFSAEYNVKSVTQTKKKLGRGDSLTDPSRFRYIIDGSRQDCLTAYHVIYDWLISNGYQLDISEFKNYIAGLDLPELAAYNYGPKANGYESLHALFYHPESGKKLSIQIRTREMHEVAESGSASHVSYKAETQGTINPALAISLKEKLQEADRLYGTVNGKLYRAVLFYPGQKLSLLDLALAAGPRFGIFAPDRVLLKRIDPVSGKVVVKEVPITAELLTGDMIEFDPLPKAVNPRKRSKQVGSLQAFLLLRLAQEEGLDEKAMQTRSSEAIAKGKLLTELAIAPEEKRLREKMVRILRSDGVSELPTKVWFSAERIAGKLGLPTAEALYLSVAYARERESLLVDMREILAQSTITTAYKKNSARTINSWLIVYNIPGLLKRVLEKLQESGLEVINLTNNPLSGSDHTLIKFTAAANKGEAEELLLSFFQKVDDVYQGLIPRSSSSKTNRVRLEFDIKKLSLPELIALTAAVHRTGGNIHRASFPTAYEGRARVSLEVDVPAGTVEKFTADINRGLSGQPIRNVTIAKLG